MITKFNIFENNKLRNEIESIIWDADDVSKLKLFIKWYKDNAPYLLKYDITSVTDHMTDDEIIAFLKHYDIFLKAKKYNL